VRTLPTPAIESVPIVPPVRRQRKGGSQGEIARPHLLSNLDGARRVASNHKATGM